jgi:ribonuclease HII
VVACAACRKFQDTRNKIQIISNNQIHNDQNFVKNFDLIRDSKMLSEKQREKLYDFICENFHIGIGICDHITIDRVNILEATYLAMKKAISSLNSNIKKCHSRAGGNPVQRPNDARLDSRFHGNDNSRQIILVDGNKEIPNLSIEQRAIVNGDKLVKSISAASIVAKVTRDRMMCEAHKKYPAYCFDQHKGYGTKIHMEALKKFGPCEIHRRSFAPVKKEVRRMN